jgi:hypothetical protein
MTPERLAWTQRNINELAAALASRTVPAKRIAVVHRAHHPQSRLPGHLAGADGQPPGARLDGRAPIAAINQTDHSAPSLEAEGRALANVAKSYLLLARLEEKLDQPGLGLLDGGSGSK